MDGVNLNILLAAGGIASVLLVATLFFLVRTLSSARKEQLSKLNRFKERYSEKQSMMADTRSIRLNQRKDGFAGMLSDMMPRREELQARLGKAGMEMELSRYGTVCSVIILVSLMIFVVLGFKLFLALMLSVITGAGLPHMYVSRRIKSRMAQFTKQFPEAIDMMVRGLKSGLPVNECIVNVGREIAAPTGTEFTRIADQMRLGKTLEEALWEAADRLDTPDFKFFVICLSVQRETGGNLGETLENLGNILRARQAMKLKIKAMSSEAKASAWIVGLLPFIMLGLILLLNYDYGIILFTHPTAMMAGVFALMWMGIGVFAMSKMITFEV